jgi:flavin-dependent thymidylate synthase
MRVSLIDYTGAGFNDPAKHAASVLIFTKSTRLEMTPGLFEEILRWDAAKVDAELKYMANTIPSSWEFCNYTFMIEGVTRAFTHQLVRTRTASFAQQTMRVLNVSGWTYGTGPSIADNDKLGDTYHGNMNAIAEAYDDLVRGGAKIEDARGILPTNIHTNIVMGANLRTFVDMARKRASPRTQSEYRQVLKGMKEAVLKVHPWVHHFISRTFDAAARDLDGRIAALRDNGSINPVTATELTKLVDQMRGQS